MFRFAMSGASEAIGFVVLLEARVVIHVYVIAPDFVQVHKCFVSLASPHGIKIRCSVCDGRC